MKKYTPAIAILILAGCAGKLDYTPPTALPDSNSNTKIINKPREKVWDDIVPQIGKQFFVINNIDKSSGLINVSYNGDPEKFIDCGRINSYVKNAQGERTYNFAGASAQQQFEIMNDSALYYINRNMTLDGRVNLIFEEIAPNKTKITANTRYVVQRQITVTPAANNIPQSNSETISFNYGNSGAFAADKDGKATKCVATGALEHELLSAIK